ncbi:MAG: N-6 DNA methylase [Acidimicrobiales bacterium]
MHDDAGRRYEATLPARERRTGGIYYTPADVAHGLVGVALDGVELGPPRRPTVCDPACGAGALLLAAAGRLEVAGHDRRSIVEQMIWGADIDGAAVAVARASLSAWAAERGARAVARHVVVADSLGPGRPWPDPPADGFDLVIGNPPFQSQLATPTARDPDRAAAARRRFGGVAAPYADSATLFLVLGCELAGPGGRVAMIQPESVLSARDAGPARRALRERASLVGLWWAGEPVFDAGVRVCAPVLEIRGLTGDGGAPAAEVRRWRGRGFDPVAGAGAPRGDSWSPLLAAMQGTPEVDLGTGSTLATLAEASAGFRDEYYGVAPFVGERRADAAVSPDEVRLVTSGLIDPLRCRWGATTTRFARSTWAAPVVDLDGLRRAEPRLAGWADQRLVPKIVLAAQTRVLEVAVDLEGRWWPSVPTIAVVPRSDDADELWRIASVLSAPATSAWCVAHFGGAALSSGAVKISASQALGIPLPADAGAWAAGADAAAAAHRAAEAGDVGGWHLALGTMAEAMADAYGVGPEVAEWWTARRPTWR